MVARLETPSVSPVKEFQYKIRSAAQRVKHAGCKVAGAADASIKNFENEYWPCLSSGIKILKNSLKIVVISRPELSGTLGPVISAIGFVSGISLFFSIKSIPSSIIEVVKGCHLKDIEGVALSSFGFVMNIASAIDSYATVHGALQSFGLVPGIALLATASSVAVLFMLGGSTVLGVYKAGWNFYELYRLKDVKKIEDDQEMINYLRKKVGVTAEEKEKIEQKMERKGLRGDALDAAVKKRVQRLKLRKRKVVARHYGDPRVVNIMRNMKAGLKDGSVDMERAKVGIHDVQKLTAVHGTVNTVTAVVNGGMFSLVTVSMFATMNPLVLPVAGIGRFAYMIGKHAFLKKGTSLFITDKELAKPFVKLAA